MPVSLTVRRILSVYPIDLPVFHPIALKLLLLLDSSDFSIDEVIALACQDQVLASRILRMANSPAYRGSFVVETMKDAVVRLGAQAVTNIAMAASQSSLHTSDNDVINRQMHKLWQHSHACALGCRWTANAVGLRRMADQSYMVGLLHDIGKLYLLKVLEKLNKTGVARSALEEANLYEVFQELHVEEGAKLMNHWGMPPLFLSAVVTHHDPQCNLEDLALIILRLVNTACRKVGVSLNRDSCVDLARMKEAALLGMGPDKVSGLESVLDEARSLGI